ncbi:MAG: hypothetical protein AMXMBFR47_01590 [Planctomycetota bacterium]
MIFRSAAFIAACLMLAPFAVAQSGDAELKKLVDTIARGEEADAEEAADKLVARLVGPLSETIGSLESRPAAEVKRIREAIGRIAGALRMRLYRVDLPEPDRKLFDEFNAQYPLLVRKLFDDSALVRESAVNQIPLDPNTGAGVLLCKAVDDENGDVADVAIEAAAKLHDFVVARGLARYVQGVTEAVAADFYGPAQADVVVTLGVYTAKAFEIIAAAGYTESVPVLIKAFATWAKPAPNRWDAHAVGQAALSLGRLRDERSREILMQALDDPRIANLRSLGGGGGLISQTVGDTALLALCEIYELDAARFGVVSVPETDHRGFADDFARRDGTRALRAWLDQYASKPKGERRPPEGLTPASRPASQPASRTADPATPQMP